MKIVISFYFQESENDKIILAWKKVKVKTCSAASWFLSTYHVDPWQKSFHSFVNNADFLNVFLVEIMSNYKRVDLIDIPCLMSPPRGGRHIVKREGRLFFKPWPTPAILSLIDTLSLLPMFWSNPSRSFFSSSTEFTAWAYYTVWFTLYNCIYYTHEIKLMISSQLSNCIHMLPLLCLSLLCLKTFRAK